jgi:hypothetical protein
VRARRAGGKHRGRNRRLHHEPRARACAVIPPSPSLRRVGLARRRPARAGIHMGTPCCAARRRRSHHAHRRARAPTAGGLSFYTGSLGLSASNQRAVLFSQINQPPATSQQYSSIRTNQHQPTEQAVSYVGARTRSGWRHGCTVRDLTASRGRIRDPW